MHYDLDDPSVCSPQTREEIGSKRRPIEAARYDLDEPYHPNKADMDWKATSIAVSLIGPNTYGFFDKDGNCLNPFAPFLGRLPTLDQIVTFLQELE